MPTTDTVRLQDVTKSYGSVCAVDGLSLTLHGGETTALLGPNGAGKTTTISLLLGLIRPDRGRVSVLDNTPRAAIRSGRIGAMLQESGMPDGVSVGSLLSMLRAQYAHPLTVGRALELAQLAGLEDRRVDRLSGGQTQRLRLAIALIGDPQLLILDEPTAAMDVEARRRFWQEMRVLIEAGRGLIFSTHHLDEVDAIADRVVVLGSGRILADGTPRAIKAAVGLRAVRFRLPGAAVGTPELEALPAVNAVVRSGDRVELRTTDTDTVVRAVVGRYPSARDIDIAGLGLEDAFVALTSPQMEASA